MKKIVALSYGHFPQGGASSIRLCSISKLFMEAGFEVYVISMGNTNMGEWNEYKGIKYISLRAPRTDILSRTNNVLKYKERARREIQKIGNVDAFLLMGVSPSVYKMCELYASENNSLLIADCTEWYSASEFTLGFFSPEYNRNNTINKRIINTRWRTISITTYFEEYFKNKGIKTVRIPALMDIAEFSEHSNEVNKERTIIYAGSPAKKDALPLIIHGFSRVDNEIFGKVKLKVIGVTQEQFISFYKQTIVPKSVEFMGRITREEVLKELRFAEFTTLMRDNRERYAMAGFPSKVAESLSSGVPVITNLSSDLSLYLEDRRNALIVEAFSAEAYANKLLEICTLSDNELRNMSREALLTAKKRIDYSNFREEIYEIIR